MFIPAWLLIVVIVLFVIPGEAYVAVFFLAIMLLPVAGVAFCLFLSHDAPLMGLCVAAASFIPMFAFLLRQRGRDYAQAKEELANEFWEQVDAGKTPAVKPPSEAIFVWGKYRRRGMIYVSVWVEGNYFKPGTWERRELDAVRGNKVRIRELFPSDRPKKWVPLDRVTCELMPKHVPVLKPSATQLFGRKISESIAVRLGILLRPILRRL